MITTLTKEGVPVIRYRTRDLTRLLPPDTRPMRRIDRIRGRSDDMLITSGVNSFPPTSKWYGPGAAARSALPARTAATGAPSTNSTSSSKPAQVLAGLPQ